MLLDEKQQGNVKVVCRFRPLNERQKSMSNSTVQQLLDDKTVAVKDYKPDKNSNAQPLNFSFDRVFDMNSKQVDVYNYAAASVIDSVIQGFNGTIFAYGQTSSGKTHTMQGQISHQINQNSGIIPRMVVQVFDSISKCTQNIQFRIKVSMVQLYMEKLRDLIDTSKSDLKIRSDKKRGIFIQNLTENYISSAQQVYQLMETARRSRAIAATNMNQRSSRSHLLFILTISQNNTEDLSAKTGKLYLVDLAGSEKVGKTGAEGKVLDEAKKINVSLTALGKVINALTDGKSTHVPYRDSKLTRVLQESLGGNSKTTLIVTCSPHPNNIAETISSLRFGVSAKKIKNKPKINKEMTVAQLQNLLQKVEKAVEQKEQYINRLKNYITVDLKQKVIPVFTGEANKMAINETEQIDLVGELERQLQIERNLNLVQQQQLTALKQKYQKLASQKQQVELELITAKNNIKSNQQIRILAEAALKKNNLELQSLNSNYLTNGQATITHDQRYMQLLQQFQKEKEKCKKSEQKMEKYEKVMQKKLSQLENNICQLTHAYYDLLIIQQRHKVDNIFLKKKLQQKDVSILSLKEKIKDLQDQNRELQQQKWNDDEQFTQNLSAKKNLAKYSISQEQDNKLNQLCEKKNINVNANTNNKVVKVLRGGNK